MDGLAMDTPDVTPDSLRAAVENNDADLAKMNAWSIIEMLWKAGKTTNLVHTLKQSKADARRFVAELLCRVFRSILDDSPSILGDYNTSLAPKSRADRTVDTARHKFNLIKILTQCAFLEPLAESGPWSHMHRAPELGRWSDALSTLDTSEATVRAVAEVVREASQHGLDMDYVVARCIHELPSGVLGLGQSAEARAYVFCRVSSAYAYGKDILAFERSRQTRALFASVRLHSTLIRQMVPILELMSIRDSPSDGAATIAARDDATGDDDAQRGIPSIWLFLVDCAKTTDAVWSQLEPVFPAIWRRYQHLTLPANATPVMTLIGWILLGFRSSEHTTTRGGMPVREAKWLRWEHRHLAWILSARIADVDDCLQPHSTSHVALAWALTRRPFMNNLASHLLRFKPEVYRTQVRSVAETMIELIKLGAVIDVQNNTIFWLRLVALCGEYTPAFEHALLQHATRRAAETVFSGMTNALTPFPTAEQRAAIQPLQQTYADAAYIDKRPLPAHLVDHFVAVAVSLARRKTALAQALQDAGVMTLLTAIADGVYAYPHAPDLVPPDVRATVRQQMCAEALDVLSARLEM